MRAGVKDASTKLYCETRDASYDTCDYGDGTGACLRLEVTAATADAKSCPGTPAAKVVREDRACTNNCNAVFS